MFDLIDDQQHARLMNLRQYIDAAFSSLPLALRSHLGSSSLNALQKLRRLRGGVNTRTTRVQDVPRVEIAWHEIDLADTGKPLLIFIHGFSDSKDGFLEAAHILRDDFSLIILDLPGFGESTHSDALTYSVPNFSMWLASFIEKVVKRPFHLMGNSLGGGVAMHYATHEGHHHPLLLSLALVGAGGIHLEENEGVLAQLKKGINPFEVYNRRDFRKVLKKVFFRPPVLPVTLEYGMFLRYRQNRNWYNKVIGDLSAELRDEGLEFHEKNLNHLAATINIPVALMWGVHDALIPVETADFLEKEIPISEKIIFDATGHVPQVERPYEFCRRYVQFLEKQALHKVSDNVMAIDN